MKVHIVRRPDSGAFRVKIVSKDQTTGAWKTQWVKGAFNQAEAEARKAELEHAIRTNGVTHLAPGSVGSFLKEWVSTRHAMGKIGPTTVLNYEYRLKKLIDLIGDRELSTLTYRDVDRAYSQLLMTHGLKRLRQVDVIFNNAMTAAVKKGKVIFNPMDRVERPHLPKTYKTTTASPKQVEHYLSTIQGHRFELLALILISTGMRIGEATGLQWGDFDFDENKVAITRIVVRGKGGLTIKTPKTKAGTRRLAVDPEVMARFKAAAGEPGQFVFRPVGKQHYSPATLAEHNSTMMEAAGLGGFTTHDLRHAHATYMLKQTPNPKIVSNRLGHAQVSTTLQIYAHVLEEDDEALAATTQGFMNPSKTA